MNNKAGSRTFNAKRVASRRLERFATGELLMMIECPEPAGSSFMRINGLRPREGWSANNLIEADVLNQKTERGFREVASTPVSRSDQARR